MNNLAPTNISIYKAIAEEAHADMQRILKENRRPNDNGEGWIITYDPDQTSFKKSMIVIIFTGMWLEALLHQQFIKMNGKHNLKKFNSGIYEEKLNLLGISKSDLINKVKRFRKTRNELVHEKAFLDKGDFKTGQDEALLAYEIMVSVSELLSTHT